ncbi:strawberry notch C-terminal domain-containing protein [Acinetobacter sp. Marseille-Q1618]|uniref:strawberry notch C-terminal domain-containing protein n=1 Tax=Acinetobacter sp. Marseille-Q1618 TaxID=2697502 RepID=UPI00156EBE0C|nr:strawberry notch C-terminal domain-containing protein [Acinetobacter sp. Marseille-Q1618]
MAQNNITWVNLESLNLHTRPAKRKLDGNDIIGIEIFDLNNYLSKDIFQNAGYSLHKVNKTNVFNIYFTEMPINQFVKAIDPDHRFVSFYQTDIQTLNTSYLNEINRISRDRFHLAIQNSTLIGMNADNHFVFATPYSRFFSDNPNKENLSDLNFESNLSNSELWKILKVGEENFHKRKNMALCAKGLANYILHSKKQFNNQDIEHFIKVILNDNSDRKYDALINALQKQYFYEQLEVSFNNLARVFDHTNHGEYMRISELHHLQPYEPLFNVSELHLQQFSTPITIAAIAQKLLIDDIHINKSILEPTIGNGALINQFVDVPNLHVVGTEIDGNRVKNIKIFFNVNTPTSNINVIEGDFFKISILSIIEEDRFDYVIANPPFGCIDKTQVTLTDADGKQYNFFTQRLDHKILLETLKLRSNHGRSVFIIGSDSFYEKGVIQSESKKLLTFIHDNYNVEGMAELDGSLYKKQGTKVNVRLISIGNKLEQTREFDLPETLLIISNELDLWRWSEGIINQRSNQQQQNINDLESPIDLPEINNSDDNVDSFFNDFVKENEHVLTRNKPQQDPPSTEGVKESEQNQIAKSRDDYSQQESQDKNDNKLVEVSEVENTKETFELKLLQVPYIPVSEVSPSNTMIPSDQSELIKLAQDKQLDHIHRESIYNDQLKAAIEQCNGNPFDGYIMHKLKYDSQQALAQAFSSEQIDALTGAILTFQTGRSYILGDQTGIGKGRTLAGILRYSLLNNERPVFFTRNAQLFSDLWRDLEATDTAKLIKNPFIFNADGAISHNNEILFQPINSNDLKSLDKISNEYDVIFTTYSQFSGRSKNKEQLLLSSCDSNTRLLLDESHVAASGESNISFFINVLKQNTGETYYSSATSLKKSSNFNFYIDIFPKNFYGQLKSILENKPTNEVLEAISMSLAKDGVFLRREHDFSKLEFRNYEAPSNYQVAARELSDQLAKVLSKMAYLSGDISKKVAQMNTEIKNNLDNVNNTGWQENRMNVESMNFASGMHNLSRQIILAVTTPVVIDQAIESLKENRKPVIGLENTGESLLNMLLAKDDKTTQLIEQINDLKSSSDFNRLMNELSEGSITYSEYQKENIVKEIENLEKILTESNNFDKILDKQPNVGDLLDLMLDRLDTIQIRDRYGSVRLEKIEDPIYYDLKEEIKEEIKLLPEIPLCPLDMITNALEEKGYKVGEISGRQLQLKQVETTDGIGYQVVKRNGNTPVEKTNACNAFQAGDLDVMILTRSGSTGLSLHAIPTNTGKSDHLRQREFLTAQAPQAIDEFLQLIGRVNRKGQISSPIISQFDIGLPIQRKLLMMHNAKLSELSINITSNRENVSKQVTDVDLLNQYGDDVAYNYLKINKQIQDMLVLEISERKDKADTTGLIKKVFNRLNFVSINTQEKIIEDLTLLYNEKIQKMNELDINPYVVKVCDWKAKTIDQLELKTGLGIKNDGQRSTFFEPAYFKTVEYESVNTPYTSQQVIHLIEKGQELMTNQLRNVLSNYYDNNRVNSKDNLREQSLPTLIKLYGHAQQKILEIELKESIEHSSTQAFVKAKLTLDEYTAIKDLVKKAENLNDLKKIVSESPNLFKHVEQQLLKSEIAVGFVRNLDILASKYESININFAANIHSNLLNKIEREIFENVLIRVRFPKLSFACLVTANFDVKHTQPNIDYVMSTKLRHMVEDSLTTIPALRNAGTTLFTQTNSEKLSFMKDFEKIELIKPGSKILASFDAYEPTSTAKSAKLLTGNLITAMNVAALSRVESQSINYTDENGKRLRALLVPESLNHNLLNERIKGISNLDEALMYVDALKSVKRSRSKFTLPSFLIVKSNANGSPVLEVNVKPLNQITDNYFISAKGNRKQLKAFSELNIFNTGKDPSTSNLNLRLSGDLNDGSNSDIRANFEFSDLYPVLKELSKEFSSVKITDLDPKFLAQLNQKNEYENKPKFNYS